MVPEPSLGDQIAVHFAYELKYLLAAAQTWSSWRRGAPDFPDADHLVVFSMESTFVHTRTLHEFMGRRRRWSAPTRSPHKAVRSTLWETYGSAVDQKVLHPDPGRPFEPTNTDADTLKDRPEELALDVVEHWLTIADQPAMAHVRSHMHQALMVAIDEAASIAGHYRAEPVFERYRPLPSPPTHARVLHPGVATSDTKITISGVPQRGRR